MSTSAGPSLPRQAGMFFAFTLLNVVLVFAGGFVIFWCIEGTGNGGRIFNTWMWAFALPVMAANHLQLGGPIGPLTIVLNPFIYGAMWWLVWRMFVLTRQKRDDDPPASDAG